MTPMVFLMFFFATAPIALMPGIIALLTRHRSRLWIVVANLALWVLIFFAARSFTIGTSSRFQVPTVFALFSWLALLGYSVRAKVAARPAQGTMPITPAHVDAGSDPEGASERGTRSATAPTSTTSISGTGTDSGLRHAGNRERPQ